MGAVDIDLKQKDSKEIPDGYKKTVIGIIPKTWEVKTLSDIGKISSGSTPLRSNEKYFNGNIPWVKTTDLNNSYIFETEEKITELALKETSVKYVEENSILIAMYGGFNQIGRTGLLKVKATTNQAISSVYVDEKEYNAEFVLHWLNAKRGYWRRLAGSSRKDPNITKNDVEDFPIAKPQYKEQKRIAQILSTWDKAIELKEKLIEQKKEQKKGLMQRLLTGKVRLPGFKGEWEKVGFDEVFIKISAKQHQITTLEYLNDGNIPVVDQGKEKIVAFTNNTEKLFKVPEEGVIVFGDHTREIKYIDFDFVVGADGTQILKTKKGFYTKFYYYHLLIQKIPNTGYNRHFKFLKEMVFKRPTIEEQKAISNVLSSLDLNIDLLKQEVSFLRQQKKGLMQLLLTGKVRVKC